eukprot:c26180_g2_i1 orf=638-3619(+)
MAISMKDVDPAFQGVGHKVETEIWRLENSHPVAVLGSEKGKFFSGETYIILQTTVLKSGAFCHNVHYWLGKDTSEDIAIVAAFKAVELDAALGSCTAQYREVEGYETDMFLSYFKPCFLPMKGQLSSGFTEKETDLHQNRLFQCKGRHTVHIKEVPFVRSSLNHNDTFVLDTESKIFQFNGVSSNIYERVKALDVVQYIKDTYHSLPCKVAIIEDGKFVADADSGEFWSHFGGFAPLVKNVGSEDISEFEATLGKLFCVVGEHAKEAKDSPLQREILDTDKCYLLDCGVKLYVWVGRNTSLDTRKAAILVANDFTVKQKIPYPTQMICVIEGFEPREFKSKFASWPRCSGIPVSEDGRGKIAGLLKQKGFNVKGLSNTTPLKKDLPLLTCDARQFEVWQMNDGSKIPIPPNGYGKFYSSDCYVILYTFQGDKREECLICSWLGSQSTMETQAAALKTRSEMASSLQGNAVQVHIFEGKEPTWFLGLFERVFIMKGDAKSFMEKDVALLEIHGSGPYNCQAIQVEPVAMSLNSSACFVVQTNTNVFTWYGKYSTVEEQESTKDMVHYLKPGASVDILKEGTEPEVFWDILGGKEVYPSHREAKETAKDPHLFSCSYPKGQLKVTELFNYSQDDLLSDEIMILDCFTDIFVWVGKHAKSEYIQNAFDIGQKYLEHAAVYEDASLRTPIYLIMDGSEPPFFTSLFSWDSTRTLSYADPFQRKLSMITGQPTQAAKAVQSRSRSPAGVWEKSRLPRGSPLKYTSPAAERVPQPRRLPFRQDTPRSNGRSPALSTLASIFESSNVEDSSPQFPIRKLPPLRLVTNKHDDREPLYFASAAPSPRAFASPRSPAIAALSSVFESFMDRGPRMGRGGWSVPVSPRKPIEDRNGYSGIATAKETESIWNGEEISEGRDASNGMSVGGGVEEGVTETAGDGATYPYDLLRVSSKNPPPHIDSAKRESYLSPEEFKQKFHMEKEVFYQLPKWKRDRYKLLLDLF